MSGGYPCGGGAWARDDVGREADWLVRLLEPFLQEEDMLETVCAVCYHFESGQSLILKTEIEKSRQLSLRCRTANGFLVRPLAQR